jgi:hypothetical protein
MSLYRVESDGCETIYVETDSFGSAVQKWRDRMLGVYGTEGTGWNEWTQPDTVERVSQGEVLR